MQATLEDLSHLVVCKQLRMLRVTEPAKPKGSNQSDTNNSNNNTTKNSTANMNTNITTNSNTSISVNTIAASNTNSAASSTTNVNNSTNAVAASNSKSTIASTESTKKSSTASAATSSSSSTTAAKAKFTSENFLENVRAFFSQLPRLNRLHVDSDKEKVKEKKRKEEEKTKNQQEFGTEKENPTFLSKRRCHLRLNRVPSFSPPLSFIAFRFDPFSFFFATFFISSLKCLIVLIFVSFSLLFSRFFSFPGLAPNLFIFFFNGLCSFPVPLAILLFPLLVISSYVEVFFVASN